MVTVRYGENNRLSGATRIPVVTPRDIAAADLNGDNRLDFVVTQLDRGSLVYHLNQGNRTFAAGVTLAVGSIPTVVTISDFNGDRQPDIAAANLGANTISILLNRGSS